MKQFSVIIASAAVALIAAGCADQGEVKVKNFADNFARHVSEGNRDSVLAYYPAAEFAEELVLAYQPDSIEVTPSGEEGQYTVRLGSGVEMTAALTPEGNVSITETRGLFHYPESRLEFARATGAIRSDINDEKLAKTMITVDNMATELFNEYVATRKNAIKNLGHTITKDIMFMMDEGKGYYTLKNQTDQPIAAGDYSITWKDSWIYAMDEGSKKRIEQGKVEIPANSTITVPFSFSGHSGSEIVAITVNTPSQEDFFKNYKSTGQEYAAYVKAHGDEPIKADHLGYGPYQLAGKLGTKLAIHLNLDKGMKHGTYYYDKYGPSNTLDLSVKAFNPNTGELTLEESNDKGQVTGTFVGRLTPEAYTGKMTAYTGKSFDFTLSVVK